MVEPQTVFCFTWQKQNYIFIWVQNSFPKEQKKKKKTEICLRIRIIKESPRTSVGAQYPRHLHLEWAHCSTLPPPDLTFCTCIPGKEMVKSWFFYLWYSSKYISSTHSSVYCLVFILSLKSNIILCFPQQNNTK